MQTNEQRPQEPAGWMDVPQPEVAAGNGTVVEAEVLPATTDPGDVQLYRASEAAALDVQVATARAYPRSIVKFEKGLEAMALRTRAIADDCTYAVPKGGQKIIGPSVRLAEMIQCNYQNLVVEAGFLEEGARHVIAVGTCRDLENNNANRIQVTRPIIGKGGKRYPSHMVETTIAAAISIARRNAIIATVPRPLWDPCWHKAKLLAIGADGHTPFAQRVDEAFAALLKLGAEEANILSYLGAEGRAEVGVDDIVALRLKYRAIALDREVSAREAFPPPRGPDREAAQKSADAAAQALKGAEKPVGPPNHEIKEGQQPPKRKAGPDPIHDDEPPDDWEPAKGEDDG